MNAIPAFHLLSTRKSSSQLLLDEERPQVRKLPDAGDAENCDLNQDPADDTRVGSFGLITELGFAFL